MKTKILLIAPLFVIAIAIFSCKPEHKPVIDQDFTLSGIDQTCILHDTRPGWLLKRVEPDCAIDYIDRYSDYANSIASNFPDSAEVRKVLSNGAFIRLEELELIVHEAKSHGYHEVFAMMAKIPDSSSDLIFAIHKQNEPESMIFYNFTQPCPHLCPWEMSSLSQ